MTISQAFTAYATDVISMKNQSYKTEENHYVCMRALLIHFGDVEVESLSFPMVRDWKFELEKNRSVETVRNYIIKFRNVLRYLELQGVPVLKYERIPVPKRVDKVPSFLTAEQVTLCIDATKRTKNKAIIALLYASGLRVSELCKLDRGMWHDGSFTVVGKGGKARLCFTDLRSEVLVREYYKTRTDNDPAVFLSDSGKRITPAAIQETFKTIRKQTGLNVHPHTLRHSFATNLMQGGMHIYSVSRLLGHSSIATTAIYLHVSDINLQREYKESHTI